MYHLNDGRRESLIKMLTCALVARAASELHIIAIVHVTIAALSSGKNGQL